VCQSRLGFHKRRGGGGARVRAPVARAGDGSWREDGGASPLWLATEGQEETPALASVRQGHLGGRTERAPTSPPKGAPLGGGFAASRPNLP